MNGHHTVLAQSQIHKLLHDAIHVSTCSSLAGGCQSIIFISPIYQWRNGIISAFPEIANHVLNDDRVVHL